MGSKQRTFPDYVKSEWASPTVSTDSVIITSAIESHQGRDVVVIDLPNAFLNADNNEQTLMLLKKKAGRVDGTHRSQHLSKVHYNKFQG